jgi:hypothetical protein
LEFVVLEPEPLTPMEQWLVMAAAVHNLGPNALLNANCWKVVSQALKWAGQWETVRDAFLRYDEHPIVEDCYGVLIRMIRQKDRIVGTGLPRGALFEGAGNFGSPEYPAAHPQFTACRLTTAGERIAHDLLRLHPRFAN